MMEERNIVNERMRREKKGDGVGRTQRKSNKRRLTHEICAKPQTNKFLIALFVLFSVLFVGAILLAKLQL
jgi:hypothetical protein